MRGRHAIKAGSLPSGEPDLLKAGRIMRPHGVLGEVAAEIALGMNNCLLSGRRVFIGEERTRMVIIGSRIHKNGLLLAFKGINSPEQAAGLRNKSIYIKAEDAPSLADGEFFQRDLIGMAVHDMQGSFLGEVTGILETGANDVIQVRNAAGSELLLPAIHDVILKIDLDGKKMMVQLLPGMNFEGP